jgi:hypothetical protein
LLIAALSAAMLALPVDITNTDLGRHLKNGEWIVNGSADQRSAVLHTNFYSFAAPEQPFVNHHWLSGVVFYLVWRLFSFPGLTLLHMLLLTLALCLAYWAAVRAAGPWIAAGLVFPAAPVIAWRGEPRPEAFTLAFAAAFALLLRECAPGRLRERWLWSLPALMLLWVNLHVGFIFAFILLGAALLNAPARSRTLWAVAAACVVAAWLNPSGFAGLIYPLQILGNIEYPVAELASMFDLRERGLWSWVYPYSLTLMAAGAAFYLRRWLQASPAERFPWVDALLYTALAVLAITKVRNLGLFLLLAIPLLASAAAAPPANQARARWARLFGIAGIAAGLIVTVQLAPGLSQVRGLDVKPGVYAPAEFLRANQIRGPIFNDFDIGGYLIFTQPGPSPVFVDGRPEAYPPGFFDQVYAAALNDDAAWRLQDARHHFNAIVLSMQDAYPGVERFILARVRDDAWAPVYADPYAIIFVRDIPEHAGVIARHRIPRQMFR